MNKRQVMLVLTLWGTATLSTFVGIILAADALTVGAYEPHGGTLAAAAVTAGLVVGLLVACACIIGALVKVADWLDRRYGDKS